MTGDTGPELTIDQMKAMKIDLSKVADKPPAPPEETIREISIPSGVKAEMLEKAVAGVDFKGLQKGEELDYKNIIKVDKKDLAKPTGKKTAETINSTIDKNGFDINVKTTPTIR